MATKSFYFPHDRNVHNNAKVMNLIKHEGMVGYGAYWVTFGRTGSNIHEEYNLYTGKRSYWGGIPIPADAPPRPNDYVMWDTQAARWQ